MQASPIIPSHQWLSHTIKCIDDSSGPSRKSSTGPTISNHCDLSGEPHPGGREPCQSHASIGWMTSQNCTTTGHQSLDWQCHWKGHSSSTNPWRGLSMVCSLSQVKRVFRALLHQGSHFVTTSMQGLLLHQGQKLLLHQMPCSCIDN